MTRKILVLQGSPRRKGNTSRLAAAFEEGAREASCEVAHFDVARMNIAGCKGCHACWKNGGTCVFDDDMSQIYPYLDDFDTIVFATPVYFFSFSAQLKCALDRFEAKLGGEEKPFTSSVLLTTLYQSAESGAAEQTVALYRKISSYLGWKDEGIIVVPHMDGPADIEGNEGLQQAHELGASLG